MDGFVIDNAGEARSEFRAYGFGRRLLYLRRDFGRGGPALLERLAQLRSASGVGNRRSGFLLNLNGAEVFVRHARRGGMMRTLMKDAYVGLRARPATELVVAAEAWRRGIRVAEPIGAMVEWIAPFMYRGYFMTRAMAGMTLWDFIRLDDDPDVRRHVIETASGAVAAMHRLRLVHADLNLHNLFVTRARDSFAVVILDLDKARLLHGPAPAGLRRKNLARLRRSARKLDPGARFLSADLLDSLIRP